MPPGIKTIPAGASLVSAASGDGEVDCCSSCPCTAAAVSNRKDNEGRGAGIGGWLSGNKEAF